MRLFTGVHNVTGNETCDSHNTTAGTQCDYSFQRLFINGNEHTHTVVLVVENEVSRRISRTVVNIYEGNAFFFNFIFDNGLTFNFLVSVKSHSPLSVILVPVTCVLVAVIMIIFGIAYYIQNRDHYMIEVADFNFGETQPLDMEYKTFRQRLMDSLRESLGGIRPLHNNDGDTHAGATSTDSSLRYGQMM